MSALARIELEDARLELERAHEAAKEMGRGAEGDEADDVVEGEAEAEDEGEGEGDWVECVFFVFLSFLDAGGC